MTCAILRDTCHLESTSEGVELRSFKVWSCRRAHTEKRDSKKSHNSDPKPQSLNPKPQTLNPEPRALNPQTLNPKYEV